jgi:GNAT superfamily N-acetyltransferase
MKEKIKVRNAKLPDLPELLAIDKEIWPEFPATEEMFRSRIETFPEGQFVAEADRNIVGSVFSQLVKYEDWADKDFTWNEITDYGTIRQTHNQNGDSVYGVGLAVIKRFQGTGASHLLIVNIVQLAIRLNCRYILLGSRIPSYHKHSEIPPALYIKTYKGKRLLDPELSLYKRYGGEPVKPLPNYMFDPESLNYGVLIRWQNPFYNKPFKRVIASTIGGIFKYL